MKELKYVPGYEGKYAASREGKIFSLGPRRLRKATIELKPIDNGNGYLFISLGKGNIHYVHSIIASTFLGPRPNGHEVHHKNHNKKDNRMSNLCYTTHSDNIILALKSGIKTGLRGEDHQDAKLNWKKVKYIRKHYQPRMGGYLGRKFGVTSTTILSVVKNKTWIK